jgi:hypothetical protein
MKPDDATTVMVTVNDEPWSRVASLHDVGPGDQVFVLNSQTGNVIFGDGVHGALPPVGSTITASYSYGAAAAGNISKRIDDSSDLAKFWIIVRADCQELGWGNRVDELFDDTTRAL